MDNRRSEILELRERGLSYRQIASGVGLSHQRVWMIVNPRKRTKKPNPDFPVLLKTGEVARMLGVHINTVRRWDNEGRLRSWRVGPRGDRRFRKDEIEETMPQPRRRPAPTGIQKGDLVIAMKGRHLGDQGTVEDVERRPPGGGSGSYYVYTVRFPGDPQALRYRARLLKPASEVG